MDKTTRHFPWLPESVECERVLKIDWSGYQLIEACKRKAGLALSWRRETMGDDSALVFGKAIHQALDVRQQMLMRESGGSDGILSAMEKRLEDCYKTVVLPPEEYRTLGRAKDVAGCYQQTFGEEPFKILASERRKEKWLGQVSYRVSGRDGDGETRESNCNVIWQGATDGIWENPDTGERSIKDTKTASRDEFAGDEEGEFSKGEAKYQMSGQFMGYCWLFDGAEFGEIKSAVLDQIVVRRPVMRVSAKTAPQNECKRKFFTYSSGQIEEWRRDVLANIADWLSACARADLPPPMTRTNCAWPKVCPYFCSCVQTNEDRRLDKLAGPRFRDRAWNVMNEGTIV